MERVCVREGGRWRGRAGGADREHGSIGQAAAPVAGLPPLPPKTPSRDAKSGRRVAESCRRVAGSPTPDSACPPLRGNGYLPMLSCSLRPAPCVTRADVTGVQGPTPSSNSMRRARAQAPAPAQAPHRHRPPAQAQAGGLRPAAGRSLPRPPTCGGQRLPAVAVRGGRRSGSRCDRCLLLVVERRDSVHTASFVPIFNSGLYGRACFYPSPAQKRKGALSFWWGTG